MRAVNILDSNIGRWWNRKCFNRETNDNEILTKNTKALLDYKTKEINSSPVCLCFAEKISKIIEEISSEKRKKRIIILPRKIVGGKEGRLLVTLKWNCCTIKRNRTTTDPSFHFDTLDLFEFRLRHVIRYGATFGSIVVAKHFAIRVVEWSHRSRQSIVSWTLK